MIDREGDNRDILLKLHELTQGTEHRFTIRGRWDRKIIEEPKLLDAKLDAGPSLGTYLVNVARKGKRAARMANMDVHAAKVTLRFAARGGLRELETLELYAVRVSELTKSEERLEWLLYTNASVVNDEDARKVVGSYQARWRVEEFHRTWKQGECNVEDAQLHSIDAVVVWATILAAVATRIERLKYFSRRTPDALASVELSAAEIEALKLDQRRRKRRKLPEMPTILATRWIAELGGWISAKGNGPPGSITLARGLERLALLVEGIALARSGKLG